MSNLKTKQGNTSTQAGLHLALWYPGAAVQRDGEMVQNRLWRESPARK